MLSAILSLAAPQIFTALGATAINPMFASAIGSGLGRLLEGGNQQDALQAAALGGLGSFVGGQLGGVDPKLAMSQATPFAGNPYVADKMFAGADLPAGITAQSLGTQAGQQAIAPTFMDTLTRPEAIGAGIGGLASDAMFKPPVYEKEKKEYPEGMKPRNTTIFPTDPNRIPGKDGEFDYRISPNFDIEEEDVSFPVGTLVSRPIRTMAEGGEVETAMSPMDAGIGGMMDDGMNDKELISSAIDVIQGEITDQDQQKVILGQFIAEFGQDALQDLVQKVQAGDIPSAMQEGDGMVEGAGDGMADMIPASMEGDQDVLLSDGEFVVPADVVSGIGNGSSDAGADKLENMMDRVRQLRTGGKTQPPAIPDEMMLPA